MKQLFQIGNPGGPGRPKRQTEAGYLRTLMGVCDLGTWEEICKAAVASAKAGDSKAREWLARYLLGTPEARAPQPLEVVIGDLLMADEALDLAAQRLAMPEADRKAFPSLDDPVQRRLEAEAKAAIIEAETQHR